MSLPDESSNEHEAIDKAIDHAALNNATSQALSALASAEQTIVFAKKIKEDIENAAKPLKDGQRINMIALVINIFVFFTLIFQSYNLEEQVSLAKKAIELNRDQINLAASVSRFEIRKNLRSDSINIQDIIYSDGSIFDRSKILNCSPMPRIEKSDEKKIRQIISHYELYFDAAILGIITKSEWKDICQYAKNLFSSNCLIENQWNNFYSNKVSPIFKSSFIPYCELIEHLKE